jgi:hypothetical protein
VNHRRGQRWGTDLAIHFTVVDQTPVSYPAWLMDLSFHGARLRLRGDSIKPGKTLAVRLPQMQKPIRALVVHSQGEMLGLLWIEYSPWVEHLLRRILSQRPQAPGQEPTDQGPDDDAPKTTTDFELPRAFPKVANSDTQRRT